MNNGTMFATLHAYEETSFLGTHPYVYVTTPDGEKRYRIFEVSEAGAELSGPAYQTAFQDVFAIRAWGSQPVGSTVYSFSDPQLGTDSRVLTLSTCVRGDGGRRFIVRALQC